MRSIRKSLIAASTAAVVALSATPAFAQSSNDETQKQDTSLSSNFTLSSKIGEKLNAYDSQRVSGALRRTPARHLVLISSTTATSSLLLSH